MLRPCLAAFVLALSCWPTTALAWTSAKVRDVRADIVIDKQGAAQVTLDIGVEVLGGWLERFDLEGLDEELTLPDAEAAWLTTDEGVVVPARAEAEGGSVTLRFDKQQAARRGLHRIGVRYAALPSLRARTENASQVYVTWTLPGWEHGLSRAEIVVRGPKGLVAVRDKEQAVELTQSVTSGQSLSTFVRVLVPRSTSWSVEVEGPASIFAADVMPTPARAPSSFEPALSLRAAALLVAWVWLVGLVSRAAFRRRARRLLATTTPWIGSNLRRRGLRVLLSLCALACAAWSLPVMLVALLALASCFVDRVEVVPQSIPLGRFAPLGKDARSEAKRRLLRERMGLVPVADIATLAGLLGASLTLAYAIYRAPQELSFSLGLMCALPLWAASSHLRLPRSTEEQIDALVRAARVALALSCGFRLVGFMVGDGQVRAPRIRVTPAARFSGLLRLDVAVDTRRTAPALVLIAVTQTDSLADRALGLTFGSEGRELSPRGHRAAHVQPVDELGAALERVFSALSAYGQRTVELSETQRAA